MPSTIYDIAEKAGVSTATVSRVLNGTGGVSEEKQQLVTEAAEALDYRPHASAQSLARQRTHLVAAIIPVVTNYFYMAILRGVQEALRESDFDLIVYAAPRPEEIDAQLDRATQRGRADGLLLFSTPLTEERAAHLTSAGRAAVLVDAAHPGFDSVAVDNERGGYLATRHLLQGGYESVAHLALTPEPPPAAARRRGYEQALREAGRPVDESLIARSDQRPLGFVEEAGYESMQALLQSDAQPDAVFAASDAQALGALRALREAGFSVPDDVALMGFDDIDTSVHVGLSTVRQPMREMGRIAVERLLERIEDGGRVASETVLAPELVKRHTCRAQEAFDADVISDGAAVPERPS